MQTRPDRGEHGCAAGCGLDVLGPGHRQPRDVRANAEQEIAARAATDADQVSRSEAGRVHRVQHVPERERVALQQRADQMRAAVGCGQAKPRGARVRVPFGRGCAGQGWHPEHAASAGGHRGRRVVQELVDIRPGRRGTGHLDRSELVAKPTICAAGKPSRVLQQPAVRARVRVQLGDAAGIERRLGDHGAHRLGGSHDVAHRPGLDHSRSEGGGHLVAAAEHHQRGAVETGGVAQPRRHRPKDLVSRPDRRKFFHLHAEGGADLLGPAAGADVEQHR